MSTRYQIFATITPGLEPLLLAELVQLGLQHVRARQGGVTVVGAPEDLWRVCLHSRLAESARVRLGRPTRVTTLDQLQARAGALAWAAFLPRGGPSPQLRVTCRKSRLMHSGAVAQRLGEALRQRLDCGHSEGQQLVHARLDHDQLQLSVDASGELLYRRGYRQHVGEAPLRETLAAACLAAAGYDGSGPLWDPFCGSGTIPIEALDLASGRAAGSRRGFAFERWPVHDARAYGSWHKTLPQVVAPTAAVMGSDINAKAVAAAQHNAARAELAPHASLVRGDFDQLAAQAPEGAAVVSNPPYGHRSRGEGQLARTFSRFGRLLRARQDLDPVLVMAGHPEFSRLTGLRWEELLRCTNRGLPVRLLRLSRA